MEVTTNNPGVSSIDPNIANDEGASKIKQTFNAARRRVKQIDLRQIIVDNPLPAVGIGLAAGAILGIVRPMPKQSRVAGVLGSLVTAYIYRTIKSMAFEQLGTYAKGVVADRTKSSDSNVAAGY